MNENVFQGVFNLIQEYLPENWEQMVLFAGYGKGSYSMKFYSKNIEQDYIDCFSMKGISKAEMVMLFMNIDKILSQERNALDERDRWSIFTMKVGRDGRVKVEFDYDDYSKDLISYEKKWKEKYLE